MNSFENLNFHFWIVHRFTQNDHRCTLKICIRVHRICQFKQNTVMSILKEKPREKSSKISMLCTCYARVMLVLCSCYARVNIVSTSCQHRVNIVSTRWKHDENTTSTSCFYRECQKKPRPKWVIFPIRWFSSDFSVIFWCYSCDFSMIFQAFHFNRHCCWEWSYFLLWFSRAQCANLPLTAEPPTAEPPTAESFTAESPTAESSTARSSTAGSLTAESSTAESSTAEFSTAESSTAKPFTAESLTSIRPLIVDHWLEKWYA